MPCSTKSLHCSTKSTPPDDSRQTLFDRLFSHFRNVWNVPNRHHRTCRDPGQRRHHRAARPAATTTRGAGSQRPNTTNDSEPDLQSHHLRHVEPISTYFNHHPILQQSTTRQNRDADVHRPRKETAAKSLNLWTCSGLTPMFTNKLSKTARTLL